MWVRFNNNPMARSVGDCAVRAVAVALDIPWETAYAKIAVAGYSMGDMPSSNSVWGAVLRQNGFQREIIPNSCPDCYTFEHFAQDHPKGIYVVGTGTHVATIKDGILYDSWNSSNELPVFVWYKPESEEK